MAVISCRIRKETICETGALRKPLVYFCNRLGSFEVMRSMREAWVDSARMFEVNRRGGARALRLGRQLKAIRLRRMLGLR